LRPAATVVFRVTLGFRTRPAFRTRWSLRTTPVPGPRWAVLPFRGLARLDTAATGRPSIGSIRLVLAVRRRHCVSFQDSARSRNPVTIVGYPWDTAGTPLPHHEASRV